MTYQITKTFKTPHDFYFFKKQDLIVNSKKCTYLFYGLLLIHLLPRRHHCNIIIFVISVRNSENSWQVIVKTSNRSFINSKRSFPILAGHNYGVIQTTDEMRNKTKNFINFLQIYQRWKFTMLQILCLRLTLRFRSPNTTWFKAIFIGLLSIWVTWNWEARFHNLTSWHWSWKIAA